MTASTCGRTLALVWIFAAGLCRSALAQDCGCASACSAGYAECVGGGVASCTAACSNAVRLATARAEVRAAMANDLDTLVPAYMRATEAIRKAETFEDLQEKFAAYQRARSNRDAALVRQYSTANVVGLLVNGGREVQAMDDAYKLPEYARPAFHNYALKTMKSVLSGGVLTQGRDAMAAFEQNGYTAYAGLCDEAELKTWANPKGLPVPHVAFGALIERKKGDWKTRAELNGAETAILQGCTDESLRANSERSREGIAVRDRVYHACVEERCKTCRW